MAAELRKEARFAPGFLIPLFGDSGWVGLIPADKRAGYRWPPLSPERGDTRQLQPRPQGRCQSVDALTSSPALRGLIAASIRVEVHVASVPVG